MRLPRELERGVCEARLGKKDAEVLRTGVKGTSRSEVSQRRQANAPPAIRDVQRDFKEEEMCEENCRPSARPPRTPSRSPPKRQTEIQALEEPLLWQSKGVRKREKQKQQEVVKRKPGRSLIWRRCR